MKSLKNFKTDEIKRSVLTHIKGGTGTTYTTSSGGSGTDTWHDCDGDGTINSGDQIDHTSGPLDGTTGTVQ